MTGPKNHPKKHAHDRPWRAPLLVAALLMLATPAMALDAGSTTSGSAYLKQDALEAAYDADAEAYIDAEKEIESVHDLKAKAQGDVQAELDNALQTAYEAQAGAGSQVQAAADTATQAQADVQAEADAAVQQGLGAAEDIQGMADANAAVSYEDRLPADLPLPAHAESQADIQHEGAKAGVHYESGADVALPDTCQVTSQIPDVKGTATSTVSSVTGLLGPLQLGIDLDAVVAQAPVDPQPIVQEACQLPPEHVQADLRSDVEADLGEEPELKVETETKSDSGGNVFVRLWTGFKGLF